MLFRKIKEMALYVIALYTKFSLRPFGKPSKQPVKKQSGQMEGVI